MQSSCSARVMQHRAVSVLLDHAYSLLRRIDNGHDAVFPLEGNISKDSKPFILTAA